MEEFRKIAATIGAGGATCRSKSDAKKTWCMSEAIKDEDRKAIRGAEAIALFRDEQAGRLRMRSRTVSPD